MPGTTAVKAADEAACRARGEAGGLPGSVELAYAAAVLFLAWCQFQVTCLPETDGYYHIKAAWLMRTQGLFHGFKWAAFSFWRDHFSDTCFLFHVYLMPFTLIPNLALAAKLAAIFLGAWTFASFFWILRLNGVRLRVVWYLLLLASGDFFLWRINVPRPQILSVPLLLWFTHFLVNGRLKPMALLCFLYPLSYSAGFLPLVFVAVNAFRGVLVDRKLEWKGPAVALGAFMAGMLAHPYFPRNLEMFYVQNFYVMKMNLFGKENLFMGGEFFPMDTRQLLFQHWPIIVAFFSVVLCEAAVGRRQGAKTAALMPIAVLSVLMTFVWKRFTEYSVPLTLLYCAFRANDLLETVDLRAHVRAHRRPAWAALGGGFLFLAAAGFTSTRGILREFSGVQESGFKGAASFLKEHARPDEVVFTCDWDEAPELFFYDHDQRYMVFMDPVFMYYWDRKIWRKWMGASNGRLGDATYQVLKDQFGARYGVCKSSFDSLRRIIDSDRRMKIVYQDDRSYVFQL